MTRRYHKDPHNRSITIHSDTAEASLPAVNAPALDSSSGRPSGLEDCPGWNQPCRGIAPQGDEKLTSEGHDGDTPDPAFLLAHTLPEPTTQDTARLVTQPHPGELDHSLAQKSVPGSIQALVAIYLATGMRAWSQAGIRCESLAVCEGSIEALPHQDRCSFRTYAAQAEKLASH